MRVLNIIGLVPSLMELRTSEKNGAMISQLQHEVNRYVYGSREWILHFDVEVQERFCTRSDVKLRLRRRWVENLFFCHLMGFLLILPTLLGFASFRLRPSFPALCIASRFAHYGAISHVLYLFVSASCSLDHPGSRVCFLLNFVSYAFLTKHCV